MRDVTDLFTDLANGTLPAVSYVKPDGLMDGHPASSKWSLFEAFAKNIIQLTQSNPKLRAETAIFVTVDEGGGFYDSGFIQWVDVHLLRKSNAGSELRSRPSTGFLFPL